MRRLCFFACCSLLCIACGTAPPAGNPDVGPRHDANDATLDGGPDDTGHVSMDGGDAGTGDAGNDDTGIDAGDASHDDTSVDASALDAGSDAPFDANNLTLADTGAAVMTDAGALGCRPVTHLTGSPLGTPYDWMGCGGSDSTGSATNWIYQMITADGGIGFFHAPAIATGSAGQAFVGTYILPETSVPAPMAIVCSGSTSTVDVDGAGLVSAFAFRNATTLHTTGTSTTGGLVMTMGSTSAVFNGDIGTHHFASATATTFGAYDSGGAYMTMRIGTTALSLTLVRYVDTIMLGILQIASGSTTDVYTFSSGPGSATDTTITLPATVSLLGTCDGAATGAASLDATTTR